MCRSSGVPDMWPVRRDRALVKTRVEAMMDVPMTEEMVEALKGTPEIPDNLLACLENAQVEDTMFRVPLDDDERMAMTEMCEWSVRTDPDTGELTEQGRLFESIIQAIIDADLAQ